MVTIDRISLLLQVKKFDKFNVIENSGGACLKQPQNNGKLIAHEKSVMLNTSRFILI